MIRNAIRIVLAIVLAGPLAACLSATAYVDPALPAVGKQDLAAVKNRAPVQLLFDFQTKGTPNAKATEVLAPKVLEVVQRSELFSDVSTAPAPNGHKLFITINNIEVTKDAAAKGVGVGLTFGLAGAQVTDGYLCEAMFQSPGKTAAKFNYQHALHTTIGNKEGPPGLTGYKPREAIDIVIEQLTMSAMRDLSKSGSLN